MYFMVAMLDHLVLSSEYNIDKDQIFVSGWSSGAEFVYRLVCELGTFKRAPNDTVEKEARENTKTLM